MGRKGIIPLASSSLHNVITLGTTIKGNITAEEDFRIDGNVEGDIICKGKIIVGPSASISGDVIATQLNLVGKITGNVTCTENIILRSTAQIIGDVKTPAIEIEPGAKFTGTCSMSSITKQVNQENTSKQGK